MKRSPMVQGYHTDPWVPGKEDHKASPKTEAAPNSELKEKQQISTKRSKELRGLSGNIIGADTTSCNKKKVHMHDHYNSKHHRSLQDLTGPSLVQTHPGIAADHAWREYYNIRTTHMHYHGSKYRKRTNHFRQKPE
ncbi:hypothetical protein CRG98_031780 [Punica granatum]|uniref:Uncharacterized protein n=1 Tax=Punica granatum TaxID=22663 RepID=A0A2I0IV04_PUNGR|nr:hypothetical protein CRG98_031780 [Punica granatum]